MAPKVLVVDDTIIARRLLRLTLAGAGFDVVEAENGVDALAILAESEIEVLVCDVNMPRMGGLDLLELVRQQPKYADLPVVFLTVDEQKDLVARAKGGGAKAWVAKPFVPERLVALVRSLLTKQSS
jgi:two-component system chemotaxis response regulator CheY